MWVYPNKVKKVWFMKKIKTLVSALIIGSMLFSLAGCAKVKAYDKKEIKAILKDDLGIKKDDIGEYESGDDVVIYTESGKANIRVVIYDDEDDAADAFEDYYDDLMDDFDDDLFDGSHKGKSSDTTGYIVFDGTGNDDDANMFSEDEYAYGGIYFCDNMLVIIGTDKDKDSARDDVDEVLSAFGFPKP